MEAEDRLVVAGVWRARVGQEQGMTINGYSVSLQWKCLQIRLG